MMLEGKRTARISVVPNHTHSKLHSFLLYSRFIRTTYRQLQFLSNNHTIHIHFDCIEVVMVRYVDCIRHLKSLTHGNHTIYKTVSESFSSRTRSGENFVLPHIYTKLAYAIAYTNEIYQSNLHWRTDVIY